ncbi:MAG: hypothetical protein BroJett030_24700 [Alphaproteobacteria bacterium]|nr:MAG: hypothetical protein BroJett030_24700 [Alphaproteobacteria bacterium]
MEYPDIIRRLPQADLPLDGDIVRSHVLSSKDGLLVFFEFLKDADIPAHSHKGQWGTVLEGSVELTVEGVTTTYRPGQSYYIPAGAVHSVKLPAGTKAIDFFEEPDRYRLKR